MVGFLTTHLPPSRFYLLDSVRLLSLNAEVLQGAARKHKRFLHYCQEPLLTGILWHILDAAHSQAGLPTRNFSFFFF